ncbi:MAG: hypothetical protein AB7N24_23445 [Dehalococcoidia bacterium]
MEAGARHALASSDELAFDEKVDELVDLYVLLLESSVVADPQGRDESYARLPAANHWADTSAYRVWSRRLLGIFDAIAATPDIRRTYVEKLAYVPLRMFSRLLERGHVEILAHTVRMLPVYERRLGEWWSRVAEEQGVAVHDACNMHTLKPPQRGFYESAKVSLVGAWTSIKNERFPPLRSETPNWAELQGCGIYYQEHLLETLVMLLAAVHRGDRAGAEWWCDVLLKWWAQLEFRYADVDFMLRGEKSITVELLRQSWEDARRHVDVEAFQNEQNAPKAVFAACIRNLWTDTCCVAMYVLVLWGRRCECDSSLAAHILHSMIEGRPLREGSVSGNLRPVRGPGDLLASMLRQSYAASAYRSGYRALLDNWVERVSALTEGEWVSGWVYGGWGANDLASLRDGQLLLLTFLVTTRWAPVASVDEVLRGWVNNDDENLRELGRDLAGYRERLESTDFNDFAGLFTCLTRKSNNERDFRAARDQARAGLASVSERIDAIRGEALRVAEVSDRRLRQIAAWCSSLAFTRETAGFPVKLFEEVVATEEAGEERTAVLARRDKGEFTEPVMAQLAVNEDDWFARTIKHHVAAFVMADILRKANADVADGSTAERYWAHVKRFRDIAVSGGYQAILLVENPTIPSWIWDWTNSEWERGKSPPYGLALTRDARFKRHEGYLGNVGEVAVFNAPIPSGASYLLMMQSLRRLEFTRLGDTYVSVSWRPVTNEERRVDIVLAWRFRLQLRMLPAVKVTYPKRSTA